jgi:hypothetical protein
MHRVWWAPGGGGRGGFGGFGGGRGGRGGAPAQSTGSFSARLTVNGQTFTEAFTINPDPRERDR